MKNFITILFVLGILSGLGGCSRKSEMPEASRITITPAITRVEGLYFETGDRIGLTITQGSGVYTENVRMDYDGAIFSAADLKWYETNDAATLTAYYPYVQSGAPAQFNVASDQSAGCENSDLLVAVKSNVTPSSSAVGMVFRHMMSVINITTTNKTASPVSELWIGGTVLAAEVDFASQATSVKQGASVAEIKAGSVVVDHSYQVVVVPQTAVLTVRLKTSDGKTRSAAFASNTLLQGKSYTMGLTVEAETLIPTLSGEVTDWENGGGLTPDNGDSGGGGDPAPEGEDTMLCQGVTYKTVTFGSRIWMAENLRHISVEPVASGIWYPNQDTNSDGVKIYGMLYNLSAARSFCPEGWRMPLEADFIALQAVLQSPADFIPLSGVFINAQNSCKYFKQSAYLACETLGSSEGMYKYCYFNGSEIVIHTGYSSENGVSVRYVKDVK